MKKTSMLVMCAILCGIPFAITQKASAEENSIITTIQQEHTKKVYDRNRCLENFLDCLLGTSKGEPGAATTITPTPEALTNISATPQEPQTVLEQKLLVLVQKYDDISARIKILATEKGISVDSSASFNANTLALVRAKDAVMAIHELLNGDNTADTRQKIIENIGVFRDALKDSQTDLKAILDLVKQSS